MTNETNAALSALRAAKHIAENDFTNTSAIVQNVNQAIALLEASQREEPQVRPSDDALWDQTIKDRDDAQDLIGEIAAWLGCKEEWSSAHSHFDCIRDRMSQREAPVAEEWSRAGLTPREMWDEIQIIRKITGDDGTHGAPHVLVQQLLDRLAARPSVTNVSRKAIERAFASAETKENKPNWLLEYFPDTMRLGLDAIYELIKSPDPAPGKAADDGAKLEELGLYLDDAIEWNNAGQPDDVFTALDAAKMTLASLKGGR